MKTLDFEQMEKVEGGITCDEVLDVVFELNGGNWQQRLQAHIILDYWTDGLIQCD